jgi:hypothetical protein
MNTGNFDRWEALYALRRAERALALEKLEKARDDAALAVSSLADERARIASLLESLLDAGRDTKLSGAALTASLMENRRQSAELSRARDEESSLVLKIAALEAEVKEAEDEVALAQKALSLLKNRMD